MMKLLKKLDDIMVAVTFAEAGEFDTAVEQMGSDETRPAKPTNREREILTPGFEAA
ncbi:MAG: hypothetical protein HZA20_02845 [Nitrospirae bacterium]|nr:hypothetical protein [Nitrospirota bacterium]